MAEKILRGARTPHKTLKPRKRNPAFVFAQWKLVGIVGAERSESLMCQIRTEPKCNCSLCTSRRLHHG